MKKKKKKRKNMLTMYIIKYGDDIQDVFHIMLNNEQGGRRDIKTMLQSIRSI